MKPFTQFLGRLVELVGAESAAKLTREFAGQTLQFPITDHYDAIARNDFGFPALVPVLGAGYAERLADLRKACTRTNGKVLLSDREMEAILQLQGCGKASCAPQVSPAALQNSPEDLLLADQLPQLLDPTVRIDAQPIQDCLEQPHLPHRLALDTDHLPNRPGDLAQPVAVRSQHGSTE